MQTGCPGFDSPKLQRAIWIEAVLAAARGRYEALKMKPIPRRRECPGHMLYRITKGEKNVGLTAKETGGTPCPVGNHIARCISVIDLGTQQNKFKENDFARQVLITWELPTEQKVFREEKGPQPHTISKTYRNSLHQKANLRKDLASWRGRDFTADELKGFDLKNVLDANCMLNVIHNENGYADIASIAKMPRGMEAPARINPLTFFSMEEYDDKVFQGLHEKTKGKIMLSPEFQALSNPGHSEAAPNYDGTEEDIPF